MNSQQLTQEPIGKVFIRLNLIPRKKRSSSNYNEIIYTPQSSYSIPHKSFYYDYPKSTQGDESPKSLFHNNNN